MNLTTSAQPKPNSRVTLWDDSYEVNDEWQCSYRVEVEGFGGEDMDGEPFRKVIPFARSADARRFANTVFKLIRNNWSADEAVRQAQWTIDEVGEP